MPKVAEEGKVAISKPYGTLTGKSLPLDQIKIGQRFRQELGDLDSLIASIRTVGLLHPIVITETGKLVAGARRLEAYRRLEKTKIPIRVLKGSDPICRQAEADENDKRLQLRPSEQVEIARFYEEQDRQEAEERKRATQAKPGEGKVGKHSGSADSALPEGKSRDKTAKRAGTGRSRMKQAEEVMAAATAEPEVFGEIATKMDETGNVSLAHKKMKQTKAKQEREALAATAPADASVITGDFREAGVGIADGSVDLVLTDPPYADDGVALLGDLSAFAGRVLRPGGLCLVYSGQFYLPQVYAALTQSLEYMWTFCIRHSSEQRFRKYALHVGWKPVVALYKPPLKQWWEPFSDVLCVGGQPEKGLHDWQQSEAEAAIFIDKLSPAAGLVVDPFAGSGTVLAAAKGLGRSYRGFEIDATRANLARARLTK